MNTSLLSRCAFFAIIFGILSVSVTQAAIVGVDDVDPMPPSAWTYNTTAHIGQTGSGTVTVDGGDRLVSHYGYLGLNAGATGSVSINESGSTWTNSSNLFVGDAGDGILNVADGAALSSMYAFIGYQAGSTGFVTVEGDGSIWKNTGTLNVGDYGDGSMRILDEALVSCRGSTIGFRSSSTSFVEVKGEGSIWEDSAHLRVGQHGTATLDITYGGLVYVDGALTIDGDLDHDSFINMSTGGMLALVGEVDNLDDFLGLIEGTDAIRYWNDSLDGEGGWDLLANGTLGTDYTFTLVPKDESANYTVLTVGVVPEPSTVAFLLTLLTIWARFAFQRR